MANNMGYISPEGLESLRKHKYQSTGYTILDTRVMNPYWEAFTRRLPLWLAPNLMTFIGMICMVLSYAVMMIYDTSFTQQVPLGVLCLSAFLQFMYQTLDACDGKQARRTGSASPLGMLVDHGCDSLSSTVIILSISQGVALGHDLNMRLLAFGVWGAFYIATWEEYHTHFCRTQMCNFGVTENQLFVMSLFIASGVLGIHFFDFPVCTVFGQILRFRELVLYIMVALSVSTQIIMFCSCLSAANNKLVAVLRLLPFLLVVGAHYCFSHYTQIYHEYPAACMVVCGLFFSLVVGRIIICSVSEVIVIQMHFPPFHWEVLSFYVFFLNSVWIRISYADAIPEMIAFLILAGFIAGSYLHFNIGIVKQLTESLGISVFTIKPKTT